MYSLFGILFANMMLIFFVVKKLRTKNETGVMFLNETKSVK